jgi:8-oxo-dGTP pyrophosphatase MutT (NUDIX family)
MNITNADEILPAIKGLGLTAPAALQPSDREFPKIVELVQDEARGNRPFFLDVQLKVQWGEGQAPKPFIVRSNLNGDGAISLAIVNGKVLLLQQWRVNLGRYTWEIPRGFSEAWESEKETTVDTLPKGMKTALRELREETGIAVRKIVPTFLGTMAENSGTHMGSPAYWLLEIDGWDVNENANLKLVTLSEAIQIVEDSHSASAMIMYLRHIAATTKAS